MSTPDPAAPPPPPNSAKKWLIGCLLALLALVLLGVAVLMLGIFAVKRQVDAIAPDAKRVMADAQRAADALKSAEPVAQQIAQEAQARMRLGRAASAVVAMPVAPAASEPCPAQFARSALTVDEPWFAFLVNGLPQSDSGTPWLRDPSLAAAADNANQGQALVALDRVLNDANAVAVVHATRVQEPVLAADGKVEPGQFEGFVQLVGFPDGETMCTAAIHATNSQGAGGTQEQLEDDFHTQVLAAEEAALGK
jgi:hypothetical protein